MPTELKDAAALIGAITGPAGLLLAALVYFRDRPIVRVDLQFDMEGVPPVPAGTYFVVSVYNLGRRPIYLSHAHLTVPRWARRALGATHVILGSGLQGVTIAEGGPPHRVPTDQVNMERFAKIWPYMRAAVIDAAGRHHYSDWPTTAPTWAGGHEPRSRILFESSPQWNSPLSTIVSLTTNASFLVNTDL